MSELDHLVVAARTLEEGSAWIERSLGVAPVAGGKHSAMGTHNRLLKLGPRAYLEVIAIDPEAPAPPRPRWFGLDAAPMKRALDDGPALVHWVERSADLERDLAASGEPAEILAMARGAYRWRIAVRADGAMPASGARPTLIEWEGAHPAEALPDSGCRLLGFSSGAEALSAQIATPAGVRELSSPRVRFEE